jgi:AbrB family looped-hinge helix DNA binding protein
VNELPEITVISSKGQVVIPAKARKKVGAQKGVAFAVSADKDIIVLKRLDDKLSADDLATLRSLKEAWQDIAEGRYEKLSTSGFKKALKNW